jgi:hypothetical protein
VSEEVRHAGRLLFPPTLALVLVIAFLPGRATLAVRVYALVVCGVALMLATAALLRASRAATPIRPRVGVDPESSRPPQSLVRLEQELALGMAGAFELHYRLRPRLRGLAGELLVVRRGLSLERDTEPARAALGEASWELIRDDHPAPQDRLERGVDPASLGRLVDSLERL